MEDTTVDTVPTGDSQPVVSDTGADLVPSLPQLLIDPPRGVYEAPVRVELGLEGMSGELRYSTDGRDPTGATGRLYTEALDIEHTTVLRAAIVVDGAIAAEQTHSYIFPDQVSDQLPPSDYPEEWWLAHEDGPFGADYTLDPEVVDDPATADRFPAVYTALPIVSLSLAPEDLFGPDGLHENSEERGVEWERSGSFEIIDPEDGSLDVGLRCGVRAQGGAARRPDRTPKKSFRVLFKSDYGPSKLELPLYEDGGVARFDTLVLRSRYNRSWANWQAGQRERSMYVRERFGVDTHREMGWLAVRGRHVQLFLNGLYWGVYLLEERPDASFHAEHLGGDKEEWDALNSGDPVDGDRDAWEEMMALARTDLSDPVQLAALEEQLDLEAFADYMLLNIALGNTDWPEKNWYAARRRAKGERWQFRVWDFELTTVISTDNVFGVDDPDTPGELFQVLRTSEEFRVLFGDRVQQHIVDGGVLSSAAHVARWQALSSTVDPAVIAESARWGDHWRDVRGEDTVLYTYHEHWLEELDHMVDFYFPTREEVFLEQVVDEGMFPTVQAPSIALAADGLSVELSAPAGEIWYSLDGSDPRAVGGAVAESALPYTGAIPVKGSLELHARALDGAEWSALAQQTVP